MSSPRHHERLTASVNMLGEACQQIEQAWFEGGSAERAAYKPLHEAMKKLHARCFRQWERNVKRGRKEGWFK